VTKILSSFVDENYPMWQFNKPVFGCISNYRYGCTLLVFL